MELFFLIAIAIAFLIGYAFYNNYKTNKLRPIKGELFACASCGKSTKHDTRTIKGFEKGVRRNFLCWECFKKWKDSQQTISNALPGASDTPKPQGCLGVILVFFVVIFSAAYSTYQYWA